MTAPKDTSANEVETLILKAARGGGLPLGFAEDLAQAAQFLDLDALASCPCAGDAPQTIAIQTALDLVMAGDGPQTVLADPALIAAFVQTAQLNWQKHLDWSQTPTGAIFHAFTDRPPNLESPKGRRQIPCKLAAHLTEMAANTLVPETEASRVAGAGAGLTDND